MYDVLCVLHVAHAAATAAAVVVVATVVGVEHEMVHAEYYTTEGMLLVCGMYTVMSY